MHILEALDRFLLQLDADGRSRHTIAQYERHIRLLARWLDNADVEAITPEDLARFLASPAARTGPRGEVKKASSVNSLRGSVRGFFGFLHRAGIVAQDPSRLVRRAITSPAPPRALTTAEQERLLAVLAGGAGWEAERDRVLFTTILQTGIRLGSALGLDVDDVDLDARELRLRRMKGDRQHVLPIAPALCEMLERWIGERMDGPLFPGRSGRRLSARHVERRLAEWLTKAGVRRKASVHSLRHTFATDLYRRTGDVLLVKEALGHRSIASTLIYAHTDRERLRRAVEGL